VPKRQSRPTDGLHRDELELEFQVHLARSIAAGFAAATGHSVQFIVQTPRSFRGKGLKYCCTAAEFENRNVIFVFLLLAESLTGFDR
jgi:hypothetical protein